MLSVTAPPSPESADRAARGLPDWDQDVALAMLQLAATAHRYRSLLARNRYGVDPSGGMAVVALSMHGPLTPSQLATLLNITPPATTELLDRLDRAGYIVRTPHPTDRRKLLVNTTSAVAEQAVGEWQDLRRLISPALERNDERTRIQVLTTIVEMVRAVEGANHRLSSTPGG